jgi:hypothetical protein
VWDGFNDAPESRLIVEATERFSDGLIEEKHWQQACRAYGEYLYLLTLGPPNSALRFPFLLQSNVYNIAWEAAVAAYEQGPLPEMLRHIIGDPFHPHPAPAQLPVTVVQLAESLYNGTGCAFALHDALLEAGQADLAEHFAKETWHPKGCWVVDLILGKQ